MSKLSNNTSELYKILSVSEQNLFDLNKFNCVKSLLANKANPDTQDLNGNTALDLILKNISNSAWAFTYISTLINFGATKFQPPGKAQIKKLLTLTNGLSEVFSIVQDIDYATLNLNKLFLPELYLEALNSYMSEIVFSIPAPQQFKITNRFFESNNFKQIIYNNDKYQTYLKPFEKSSLYSKGISLTMPDNLSIGYNIALPKTDTIKAVWVQIYGGIDYSFNPGEFNSIENYLLDQGIAVASLNLIDLTLAISQQKITEEDNNKIHNSINYFFKILREDPNRLDENLNISESTKIILFGASHGGLKVAKHAELFPDSYDGYIGLNGGYLDLLNSKMPHEAHLLPTNKVITKAPLLLIHCLDDNRVPFQVSSQYYIEAKEAGKNVHLVFCPKGGSKDKALTARGQVYLKGHGCPYSEASFNKAITAIENIFFGETSNEKQKAHSDLEAYEGKLYTKYNYYPLVPLTEQCSSIAYNIFKYEQQKSATDKAIIIDNIDEFIQNFGIPTYTSMLYINQLRTSKSNSSIKVDTGWLKSVSNDNIKKAIQFNFINFMEIANSILYEDISLYYEGLEEGEDKIGFNFDQTLNQEQTIARFRTLLEDCNNPNQCYLIKLVLLNNLHLVNELEYFKWFNANTAEWNNGLDSLKQYIHNDIEQLNNFIQQLENTGEASNLELLKNMYDFS